MGKVMSFAVRSKNAPRNYLVSFSPYGYTWGCESRAVMFDSESEARAVAAESSVIECTVVPYVQRDCYHGED